MQINQQCEDGVMMPALSTREIMPDREWRALSNRISDDIAAGFDIPGLTALPGKGQKLLTLPRDFRVHKVQHNRQMYTTVSGLSLYGELDRAVAGLLPLREIPVEEYRVPDYSTLAAAIATAYFFSSRAGRADLVEVLQPLWEVAEHLYFPNREYWASGRAFNGSLDFTAEEIRDRSHWSERMWVGSYVHETANLGHAYLLRGSEEYPRTWLLNEIDRYANAVFATPGFEPFTDH